MRVCGLAMTPRIILMTDGEPTDSAGSVEVGLIIIRWPDNSYYSYISTQFIKMI